MSEDAMEMIRQSDTMIPSDFSNIRKRKGVLRKVCKWISFLVLSVIILFLATLFIRTWTKSLRFVAPPSPPASSVSLPTPTLSWSEKLAGAISYKTEARNRTDISLSEIDALIQYLEDQFPLVFSSPFINVQRLSRGHSLLLRVSGNINVAHKPYLLISHLDVVPPGNIEQWKEDPWKTGLLDIEGVDYIYGRGAVDAKHMVIGILQAIDILLSQGFQPERTFYVAFGHDEEVYGEKGAGVISKTLARTLENNKEILDFILDEGMAILEGIFPGVPDPVVYIGVAEKGYATLKVSVKGGQSHSSFPPKETTIGILSRALWRLEENPFPAKFGDEPTFDSVDFLAPHASFPYNLIFSNLWLFSSLVSSSLSMNPGTDATQRTTTALTIVKAGVKDNVIPGYAEAIVNHRIFPGEDLTTVLEHDRRVVGDKRVNFSVLQYNPPPPVSPYSSEVEGFSLIASSALQVFPEARVTPGLVIGGTDSKHYLGLTNKIYRFSPVVLTKDDIHKPRFHGVDERISVDNFNKVVEFYFRLISNSDKMGLL